MKKHEETRSLRERVGIILLSAEPSTLVTNTVALEEAGVDHVWIASGSLSSPDLLTTLAGVAERTSHLKLGTYIVQATTRHPVFMAQQILSLNSLAPGRLRLGIGTGSLQQAKSLYGIEIDAPLAYLREYIEVLRPLLEQGEVHHQGRYFTVDASLPGSAQVPLFISALGERAFRLAGEVTDGALPFLTPYSYVFNTAFPALTAGAEAAGRNRPPLVAHVPVAFTEDRATALQATRKALGFYPTVPSYYNMFLAAGFTEQEINPISDRLIESLLVFGNEDTIRDRLVELLSTEIDALALSPVPVSDAAQDSARLARFVSQL